MNKTYFLSEILKTGILKSSLIVRQYKLDLMARFMEVKAMNPKITQNESAKQLRYSSATVKRYRIDINMPSLYRIQSNTNKRKQKFSNVVSNSERETKVSSDEPKRYQKEPIITETNTKSNKRNKNNPKGGAIIEINEKKLDEIVHNNYL